MNTSLNAPVPPDVLRDRIRGCLIGGAAGDALGYPVEFMDERSIFRRYGEGGIRAFVPDKVIGKALISDDTQMTLFTANGVLTAETLSVLSRPARDPHEILPASYQDWLVTQEKPFVRRNEVSKKHRRVSWLAEVPGLYDQRAPGNTCLSALQQQLADPSASLDFIENRQNNSKGCGGVMRAAPLGLRPWPGRNIDWIDMEAARAAAITHGHSLGFMPAAVLAHIVHRLAFRKTGLPLREIILEARYTAAHIFEGDTYLPRLLDLIDEAMARSAGSGTDLENIHALGEGWVSEEALAVSVYCALRFERDFSAGIIAAVNHRGDSDSTGAITGNILGALHGYSAMDSCWKTGLELSDVILEISDDLARGCPLDKAGGVSDPRWLWKYVMMGKNEQISLDSYVT